MYSVPGTSLRGWPEYSVDQALPVSRWSCSWLPPSPPVLRRALDSRLHYDLDILLNCTRSTGPASLSHALSPADSTLSTTALKPMQQPDTEGAFVSDRTGKR